MTILNLIYNNLRYHFKSNIWIVLGTMMSTAILIGALIIGDSVRYSLDKIAHNRLGTTKYALTGGDRFFRSELAAEISNDLKVITVPLLQTQGVAVAEGGVRRFNNINVYGVEKNFNVIAGTENIFNQINSNEIAINSHLAKRAGLAIGEEFLLRFEKLDSMPKETPLSSDEESTVAKRFKVKFILADEQLGRFGLRNEQAAPFNVFLSLENMSAEMNLTSKANMLLVSGDDSLKIDEMENSLENNWTLDDFGIKLNEPKNSGEIELRSTRIFLDQQLVNAVDKLSENPQKILTYFVNEIKKGNKSTPYSFITGVDKDLFSDEINENEIIVNSWLANDLKLKQGEKLQVKYFKLGDKRNLIEDSTDFIVKQIVPVTGEFADQTLMPDFPGLTEAESCLDWHPGIPIDFDKIRKKDEKYWDNHKGTPKAFVSLKTAQNIWGNRFGELTAIRFAKTDPDLLSKKILKNLSPENYGIRFTEVKNKALKASSESTDFSGLFIGLSFFVIISSLLLTGLLFVLNIESRSEEQGILAGLGFQKKIITRIIFTETFILISIGSFLGIFAGIGYNQIVLEALKTIWSDIVGTSALEIHIKPLTLLTGFLIGMITTLIVVFLFLRKQLKISSHQLQRTINRVKFIFKRKMNFSFWTAIFLSGLIFLIFLFIETDKATERFGAFFLVGILSLVTGILFVNAFLNFFLNRSNGSVVNLFELGFKSISVNRKRSLMLVSLLASGLFIVFTVGINKKTVPTDLSDRKSGTGGFSFIAKTSIPFYSDLNSKEMYKEFGFEKLSDKDFNFIQFRVKKGDDASCLNLNRVTNPQVIGIDPKEFIEINPFQIVSAIEGLDKDNPWKVFEGSENKNYIPAIANETDIIWQMGKAVGDTLTYMDDKGEKFKIKLVAGLANSIFQGNIIIGEKDFIEKFSSVNGSNLFLIDGVKNSEEFSEHLLSVMVDYGLTLEKASDKLAEFNKIENTYLSIFLILGSFGIFLGSFGMVVVIFRNVMEQKNELAVLQAVGINKMLVKKMIINGHIFLLITGIVIGVISSFISSISSLNEIPVLTISVVLFLVSLNGIFWTNYAVKKATAGNLIVSLRNE